MNRLMALAAILEAVTGVTLMIAPAVVARLLLGSDVSGAGLVMGRVAGIALLSLGVACWPVRNDVSSFNPTIVAMLTYNLLVACYLISVGTGRQPVGILLWPGVVLHGLLTLLLSRAWFMTRQRKDSNG